MYENACNKWRGSHYRYGRVGRGIQRPFPPQPPQHNSPPHKHTQKVSKMLVFPLFNSIITDRRINGPTDRRTNGPTDGQSLLYSCVSATKNAMRRNGLIACRDGLPPKIARESHFTFFQLTPTSALAYTCWSCIVLSISEKIPWHAVTLTLSQILHKWLHLRDDCFLPSLLLLLFQYLLAPALNHPPPLPPPASPQATTA